MTSSRAIILNSPAAGLRAAMTACLRAKAPVDHAGSAFWGAKGSHTGHLASAARARYIEAMSMTVAKFRSWLYWIAKGLGDYRAVKTGRVARRIGYRITGKMTGRALGGLWR